MCVCVREGGREAGRQAGWEEGGEKERDRLNTTCHSLLAHLLFLLLHQSNVPLDLQEVDKGSAVISHTPPDIEVR